MGVQPVRLTARAPGSWVLGRDALPPRAGRPAADPAGYTLGAVHVAIDDTCAFINLVMAQSPEGGTQASPGTAVSITIGKAQVLLALTRRRGRGSRFSL